MRKTFYIIAREYITRVRKKSFILLTILGPVFFGLVFIVVPVLIMNSNTTSQKILVKDESGLIPALPDSAGVYFSFKYKEKAIEELKTNFSTLDGGYDALVYIPNIQPDAPYGITLYSNEQVSITTKSYVENVLADKLEEINIQKLGLEKKDILKLRPKIVIDDEVASADGSEKSDAAVATGIGYVSGFLIYIILLIYGSMVMRGVMEEKQNRIVEVMISSVKPIQLMMGKIVGIGLVGLTQFIIWIVLGFIIQIILSGIFAPQLMEMQNMQSMQPQGMGSDNTEILQSIESLQNQPIGFFLFIFCIYFLGGYLIYSALFAAIGSLSTDNDSDVQMYAFPVTMLILISIFIMMAVVQQPHTKLAFWASIIPFSSPIVMPAIMPFDPPLWHIILSVGLLILGFIFTTWFAARIYRTGILMYGKKIKFMEIVKWMFYKG
ncbi:MAG: ABC transporter permease [Fimbriimonadaceae bacterium]|nr:ABC transporter permease [Chitinophagales bacterium]